ncbi:MAG: TonB-dependent receptor [Acidobacteria bacterium]|nr:TonB-dependent receptor [Acidobacteriota bacterium]
MQSKTGKLTLALCLVACCATLTAEAVEPASISGTITDPQKALVPDTLVTLHDRSSGLRLRVTTDASGEFRFRLLRPGEYILEVESRGFAPVSLSGLQVEAGQDLVRDIALQLAVRREEVVVTASGRPQSVDEVSKALTVINSTDMQERGETSLAEALRPIPGLRIQQLGTPGAQTTIRTRGLRVENTSILIDGLRFRDAAAPQGDATSFVSHLLLADTHRVEVLRGSGSSLYGSHAIGGVVNMMSAEGGGRTRGSLLTEGGSLGRLHGRARLAGGFKQDRFTYSTGLAHRNISRGVDGDDASRNTTAQGRLNLNVSPTANLSARFYGGDTFLQLNRSPSSAPGLTASGIVQARPLAPDLVELHQAGTPLSQLELGSATFIPTLNDPDARMATDFLSSAVLFNQQPTARTGYSLSYQNLRTDRIHHNGPGGAGFQPLGTTRSDFGGRVQTVNARTHLQVGTNHFIDAGYEFENERFINRNIPVQPSPDSLADVTQHTNAFHIQDQLRLLQGRLHLSAAFRVQMFSLQTPLLEPLDTAPYQGFTFDAPPTAYTGDGSIAYFVARTGTKFRAHAGNGYRSPSLYERFGTFFSSFGYSAYGDPRLRPDRAIAFDAGLDQALLGNRVQTSLTWFYTRIQENIVFDFSGGINPATDPFGRFGGYRNSQGGLARGLEVTTTVRPSRALDLRFSYTYTNADERVPRIGNVLKSYVIPDHQWSLLATQWLGRNLFVNLDWVTSSSTLAPIYDPSIFSSRVFRFDSITKVDLGASYRLPLSEFRSLRFFGRVDNLLDRQYYENGFLNPGATGTAGLEYSF